MEEMLKCWSTNMLKLWNAEIYDIYDIYDIYEIDEITKFWKNGWIWLEWSVICSSGLE